MRLLSLDYEPVFTDATLAGFDSDESVFDFDATIWDPAGTLNDFIKWHSSMHQGLPLISGSSSVRMIEDVKRRKREFVEYINSGRTLVAMARPPQTCYVDSGQRRYSGTGKNQVETTLVTPLDMNAALPFTIKLERAGGTRIQFDGDSSIVRLLRKYSHLLRYQAVITETPGTMLAHVAGTQRVVSTICKTKGGGYLVMLPAIYFERDEETNELSNSDASDFQDDLLDAIEHLNGSKVLSRPTWAPRYATEEKLTLRAAVAAQQAEVESARAKLAEILRIQESAEVKDQLFLGTGRALELEVRAVLELLGGTVTEPEAGRDDWRVSFPEGDAVVEVKGVSKSAAEKHAAQLEKWVAGAFEKTGKTPKGILIVNTWRELPLEERTQDDFPPQMLPYCESRGHCLVTGLQLFTVRKDVESHPERAEHWRSVILTTSGKVTGCDDWRNIIKTIEVAE